MFISEEKFISLLPVLACLLAVIAVFTVSSCGGLLGPLGFEIGPGGSLDEPADGKLSIVTSVYPITCLLDEIGTHRVVTTTLLPPGGNAHLHEVTTEQMTKVTDADLLIRIGGDLDDWVLRAFTMAPDPARRISVIDNSRNRAAAEPPDSSEAVDRSEIDWSNPHFWLDPLVVRDIVVPLLTDNLVAADPAGREHYLQQSRQMRVQLTQLHDELTQMFDDLPTDKFLADHAAWTHFASRYELTQVGVLQECTASEPDPAALSQIIREASEDGVSLILTTRGHSDQLARTVAESTGASILQLDPIGDPNEPEKRGYFELMRYTATKLSDALNALKD